jgi:transposase
MAETRETYTTAFKQEAVRLITEPRYGVAETARHLGIHPNLLRRWQQEYIGNPQTAFPGHGRLTPDQEALRQLREANKRLQMEREIVKKALHCFVNAPH